MDNFTFYKRNLNKKKIRILIEGDCSSYIKNVDESFKIIEKLDKDKFEVWYLSYRGKPKKWYRYDKFFHKIQHGRVNEIYYKCDILIKSSRLESFSYPPLEMLATGGYCIVVPNEGNQEYLRDGENCLFYQLGDLDSAIKNINKLIIDEELQKKHILQDSVLNT
jgi:glycosyltransferase involved in cell wall biosynthesis